MATKIGAGLAALAVTLGCATGALPAQAANSRFDAFLQVCPRGVITESMRATESAKFDRMTDKQFAQALVACVNPVDKGVAKAPPPPPPRRVVEAPPPPPEVVEEAPPPVSQCAYVLVQISGWHGGAFRVIVNGKQHPIMPQGNRICIPRKWFEASLIEICLGYGPRAKRKIEGRWMQIARYNLQHGDVVNPGQPMVWINRPDPRLRRPGYRPSFYQAAMPSAVGAFVGSTVAAAIRPPQPMYPPPGYYPPRY